MQKDLASGRNFNVAPKILEIGDQKRIYLINVRKRIQNEVYIQVESHFHRLKKKIY